MKCERNKKQNNHGRRINTPCGRIAKFQQEDGIPLCERHFRIWFKKYYKFDYMILNESN